MDKACYEHPTGFPKNEKDSHERTRSLGTDNRTQYIAYLLIVNAHFVLFIGMVNTFSAVLLGNACRISEVRICNSYLSIVYKRACFWMYRAADKQETDIPNKCAWWNLSNVLYWRDQIRHFFRRYQVDCSGLFALEPFNIVFTKLKKNKKWKDNLWINQ